MKKLAKIFIPALVLALIAGVLFSVGISAADNTETEAWEGNGGNLWDVLDAAGQSVQKYSNFEEAFGACPDGGTVKPLYKTIHITKSGVATSKLEAGETKTTNVDLGDSRVIFESNASANYFVYVRAGHTVNLKGNGATLTMSDSKGFAELLADDEEGRISSLNVDGVNIVIKTGFVSQNTAINYRGGNLSFRNLDMTIGKVLCIRANDGKRVSFNMENVNVTQTTGNTANMWFFQCVNMVDGSEFSFKSCNFKSDYRLFNFRNVSATPHSVTARFEDCTLDITKADHPIRVDGGKFVLAGEIKWYCGTPQYGLIRAETPAAPTLIEVEDGMRTNNAAPLWSGSTGAISADSSPLSGFSGSAKFADRDCPFVYNGPTNEGTTFVWSANGAGKFFNGVLNGETIARYEEMTNPVDGNKYHMLTVEPGKFGINPYIQFMTNGLTASGYKYMSYELDVSTTSIIPDYTFIYMEGRNSSGSGSFYNGGIMLTKADDGMRIAFFKGTLGSTREEVGSVVIPRGEWAHITYAVELKTEALESDPNVNASVARVFVNGECIGTVEGIFRQTGNGVFSQVGDVRVDSCSNIWRETRSTLYIDNVRVMGYTTCDFATTVFGETPSLDTPYLGRVDIEKIPSFIVGDRGFVDIESAVAYAAENNETLILYTDLAERTVINTPITIDKNGKGIYIDSEECCIAFDGSTITLTKAKPNEFVEFEIFDADDNSLKIFRRPVGALIRLQDEVPAIAPIRVDKDVHVLVLTGWYANEEEMTSERADIADVENGVALTPVYSQSEEFNNAVAVKSVGGEYTAISDVGAFISELASPAVGADYMLLRDITVSSGTAGDYIMTLGDGLRLDLCGRAVLLTHGDGGAPALGAIGVAGNAAITSGEAGAKLIYRTPVYENNTSGAMFVLTGEKSNLTIGSVLTSGYISVYTGVFIANASESDKACATVTATNIYHTGKYSEGLFRKLPGLSATVAGNIDILECLIVSTSDMAGGTAVFAPAAGDNTNYFISSSTIISDGDIFAPEADATGKYALSSCTVAGDVNAAGAKLDITLAASLVTTGTVGKNVKLSGFCAVVPGKENKVKYTLYYKNYTDDTPIDDISVDMISKEITYTSVSGHVIEEEWFVKTPATCTENGERVKRCTVCTEEIERETIPAAHHYGEWTTKTPATCNEAGEDTRECSVCHDIESREIPATGHIAGEWTVKTPATCEEDGVEHKKCTVCDYELETRAIPAIGHDMTDWAVTKEATCKEMGEKTKTCKHEGCTHTEHEDIPMIAHTESEWIVDKPATATDEGSKHKECTVCHTKLGDSVAIAKVVASINEDAKEWSKKSETLPTIKFNESVSDITEVKVNGEKVDPKNYIVKNGELTFTKEYLETLKAGEYTVEALSATGNANASFTVKSSTNVALIVVLIVVGVIIVGGAVAFVIIKKKKA